MIMMNRIIKITLWFCLVFLVLLTACAGKTSTASKYHLMVIAGHGKQFFAHRVVYVVDEFGILLNLDLPKQENLGNNPVWSPDGQWIAHSYTNPDSNSADIYLMRSDNNSKTVRVTDNRNFLHRFAGAPAWSPDGTQIAFYAPEGIYLLNVKCITQGESCTPEPTFLIPGDYPAWSPDGKEIVYRDTSSYEIQVIDLQNPSKIVKVSQGLSPCGSAQWSPDGKKITFDCNETIYSVDPDGRNRVSLVNGRAPRWTPDGKKIAFIGTKILDPNLGHALDSEGSVLSTAVFIMDATGENITRITKRNDESVWFTWIPANNTK
jgi:Tol biopolymer transport system component